MIEASRGGIWTRRLTRAALVLTIGGLAAALIAAVGSGQGAWSFRGGFDVLRWAFYAAVAGGVLALVAFVLGRRSGVRSGRLNLLALAVALAFGGYIARQVAKASSVPAIHDVATNLDDLPQFAVLKVRADNLENIPEGDDATAALPPLERWKAIHRKGYADIRTVPMSGGVADVTRRADALARARGWAIARSDPAAGAIEATDTSLFFRFKDDVVVRVRPDPVRPGGSVVDMRSISRVGGSDIGVNAARIRAFLRDMRAR